MLPILRKKEIMPEVGDKKKKNNKQTNKNPIVNKLSHIEFSFKK